MVRGNSVVEAKIRAMAIPGDVIDRGFREREARRRAVE